MGSAWGGEWRPSPNKPDDARFLGQPGEIKYTIATNKHGVRYQRATRIGKDGKADLERHYTNHENEKVHSNPHDHRITWDKGFPYFEKPICYPDGEAPSFKCFYNQEEHMGNNDTSNVVNDYPDLSFTSISDFKWCMQCGGEVQFEWKGKSYTVFGSVQKDENAPVQMNIGEGYYTKNGKHYNVLSHTPYDFKDELWADTADEILEYNVGGDRLRDVITKVEVLDRTI